MYAMAYGESSDANVLGFSRKWEDSNFIDDGHISLCGLRQVSYIMSVFCNRALMLIVLRL